MVDETLKTVCKKRAKKVWNPAIAEQLWTISELWFRSFSAINEPAKLLDDKSVALLRKSWEVITLNANNQATKNFSTLFYKRAFELAPHVRGLFKHSMDAQGNKLMLMIAKLLDLLGDSLTFTITLEELGSRHRMYKVPASAFSVFHESFLYSLELALAGDWNSEIRSAWICFCKLLEDIMAPQMGGDSENPNEVTARGIAQTHVSANILHSSGELNLCNLKITSFPDPEPLAHVQQLILRNNNISQLPASVGVLKNIQLLDLSKNKLKTIPSEIGSCTKLQRLYLGNNVLKELPNSLGLLTQLTKLVLNNNKLRSLPESMYKMRALVHLDASNNKLKTIPWQLYLFIDQLKEINLTNNSFKLNNTNPETLKENIRTSHFLGETSSDTLKFALLGCECAGKTVSFIITCYGWYHSFCPVFTSCIKRRCTHVAPIEYRWN